MDDFDLNGMDPQSAKQYVAAVITSLKKTKEQRVKLEKELDLWRGRVSLARERGRSDLQSQAEIRVQDLSTDLERIRAEELELLRGVDRMKAQLKDIESRPAMSIDSDRLLAELELLVGETDDLTDRLKNEEAAQALERLKSELDSDGEHHG